ncbi:MAG: 8-amino-7-oxononanoate synthase [Alphaproteobacteria bacterium]|nr:8-amino-7-oxononanoate synthase [Alphaproteobacteria bacterium]
MPHLNEHCEKAIAHTEQQHLRRRLRTSAHVAGAMVDIVQDGVRLVSFADNDYLGLRADPRVIAAGQQALAEYGAGAGASRLVTGNHPLYAPLEQQLAAMKGAQAALVFGSGYLTNLGVIPALMGKGDVIFADKLVHACILDAAQLSGARLIRFAHNDMPHLETLLKEHREESPRALIVTDHVFSMDGDVAPLASIAALAERYDAWTMADDAHGLGIVPAAAPMDIWMGTLSKAAGGYGGYVVGSQALIDFLVTTARSLVFSTGLPPALCASAQVALEIIAAEPERGQRALQLAQRVTEVLGLPLARSAIVPVMLGTPERALAASEALRQQGLLAVAIRPPTVPPGTARLRLAFSCAHTDAQVEKLIAVLKEVL